MPKTRGNGIFRCETFACWIFNHQFRSYSTAAEWNRTQHRGDRSAWGLARWGGSHLRSSATQFITRCERIHTVLYYNIAIAIESLIKSRTYTYFNFSSWAPERKWTRSFFFCCFVHVKFMSNIFMMHISMMASNWIRYMRFRIVNTCELSLCVDIPGVEIRDSVFIYLLIIKLKEY